MKLAIHKKSIRTFRKTLVALAVLGMTQYVFAVDGTLNGGGSKSERSSFSSIKKDLNFSLKSGFAFNNNKSIGLRKSGKNVIYNNIISYQKGNVTYYRPYHNKPILQKFKTPSAPVIR
jgi:hypothetical protein